LYDHTLLKELRHTHGLTQQQLAGQLHMDRSTYAYYETGHTRMNVDTIVKLCRIYHMSLYEFLGIPAPQLQAPPDSLTGQFFSLSREEQDIVIRLRSYDDNRRRALLAYADAVMRGQEA